MIEYTDKDELTIIETMGRLIQSIPPNARHRIMNYLLDKHVYRESVATEKRSLSSLLADVENLMTDRS